MKLIVSNNNNCVAASLAMLIDVDINHIQDKLFTDLTKPFPGQWSAFPKVPDMNVICGWLWWDYKVALVPFEYDPQCAPHKDCPPTSVYPTTTRCPYPIADVADVAFNEQVAYGPGLIEGTIIGREVGHMCAWDGQVIYDPRGYCYSRNVAQGRFHYQITRFWLAVKGKTL